MADVPITGPAAPKPVAHGGDLGAVTAPLPDGAPALDRSVDRHQSRRLSRGRSCRRRSGRACRRARRSRRCSSRRGARYGVADPATIVAAPGTQALIQLLPRLVPTSRVAIVGPTYAEHELCWRRAGHDVGRRARHRRGVRRRRRRGRQSGQSHRPARPAAGRCGPSKRHCWSSTKPSSTSCRPRRAWPAICPPTRSSCDPSARPMAWRACGWASPSRRSASPGGCGTSSVRGPCPGPPLEIGRIALDDEAWLQAAAQRLAADQENSTRC